MCAPFIFNVYMEVFNLHFSSNMKPMLINPI